MTKHSDLIRQLIDNPPAKKTGATYITSFWAGYEGVKGVRHGKAGSLARAAWTAGAQRRIIDNAATKGNTNARVACPSCFAEDRT